MPLLFNYITHLMSALLESVRVSVSLRGAAGVVLFRFGAFFSTLAFDQGRLGMRQVLRVSGKKVGPSVRAAPATEKGA